MIFFSSFLVVYLCRRQQKLLSIIEQLKTKECRSILAMVAGTVKSANPELTAAGDAITLLRRWKQIDINLTEAANETKGTLAKENTFIFVVVCVCHPVPDRFLTVFLFISLCLPNPPPLPHQTTSNTCSHWKNSLNRCTKGLRRPSSTRCPL